MAETAWERALRLRSAGLNAKYAGQIASAPTWSPGDVEAPEVATGGGSYGGAVAAPAAAPPPSSLAPSIKLPGYDPDYSALIQGDPGVIAGDAELNAFSGKLGDARKAAVRRAVIAAGLAPGSALADIDEGTRLAAQGNQFSAAAGLGRERDRAGADLGALLGARGLTFSGAQEGGSQRIQEGYEQGSSQLVQQLLDQISGYESDFASKLSGVTAQYRTLREQAALRVQADPRYQPIGETDAILDPSSGLYMTPDGRWYNSDRVRVAAPGATAPAAPASTQATAPPNVPEFTALANATAVPGASAEEIRRLAAAAVGQPGFYESDNAQALAAAAAGRNYF